MKNKWRIFLVCNILEILTFLLDMFLDFYRIDMFTGTVTFHYGGIFLIIGIIAIVLTNCIKNIYLVKVLFNRDTNVKVNGIVSWIISILFLIIIFLLSFGLFREYTKITSTLNKKDTYLIIAFILQTFIVVNGVFILYNQGPLRRLIRSRFNKEVNISIEELGS